jgi:hypothetical protein
LENSLVNDVAFGIERQFALETTHSADTSDGPDRAKFHGMRRHCRPDDEFLETVFETPTARVTPRDSFGACVINRGGQSLTSVRFLQVHWAGAESTAGFWGAGSAATRFQYFAKAAESAHDPSGLNRKKYGRALTLRDRWKCV